MIADRRLPRPADFGFEGIDEKSIPILKGSISREDGNHLRLVVTGEGFVDFAHGKWLRVDRVSLTAMECSGSSTIGVEPYLAGLAGMHVQIGLGIKVSSGSPSSAIGLRRPALTSPLQIYCVSASPNSSGLLLRSGDARVDAIARGLFPTIPSLFPMLTTTSRRPRAPSRP